MVDTQEQWADVNPIRAVWEDEGYIVEGEYRGWTEVTLPTGLQKRYTVQPEDAGSQPVYFYGTVVLWDLLASIKVGEFIRIEYLGVDDSSTRPIKRFALQRRLQI